MRKYLGKLLASTVMVASASMPTFGQDIQSVKDNIPQSGAIDLSLFSDGKPDGFMYLGWERSGDTLKLFDRSMMASSKMYETMVSEMTNDTLAPLKAQVKFFQNISIYDVAIDVKDSVVNGGMTMHQPGQDDRTRPINLDLSDQEGIMFRAAAFVLPHAMPQEVGTSISFPWYSSISGAINDITLKAEEDVTIETPVGSFDTIKYSLTGGSPSNDIYVTKGEDRKIVRIDVRGTPIQFLYTKTEDQ